MSGRRNKGLAGQQNPGDRVRKTKKNTGHAAHTLPPRLCLQVLVDELDSLAVNALNEVPESGMDAFAFPLSNLRIEFGNLVKELLQVESCQRDRIYRIVDVLMQAAFLIGHHGPPSPNAAALTRRLGTTKARQAKVDPVKDAVIEAAIDKLTAGWDGSKRTDMSVAISKELEGTTYRMTPRGIRDRLKKRGFYDREG